MNRRISLLIFGFVGTAILMSLGFWQLQRMTWKAGILAEIDTRLAEPPVGLPVAPDPVADKYLQVEVTGRIGEGELHVLTFGDVGRRWLAGMAARNGQVCSRP
jgi:surfeit locus 1 family protein